MMGVSSWGKPPSRCLPPPHREATVPMLSDLKGQNPNGCHSVSFCHLVPTYFALPGNSISFLEPESLPDCSNSSL
jgi:hypothetical protein